jgi:Glucose-6-phosphate isomerase
MDLVSIDYTYCMEDTLGRQGGLSPYLLEAVRLPLEQVRKNLVEHRRGGGLAWMELPHRNPADLLAYAAEVRGRFDTLVVLGIGGSALGTTALATALLHPYHNMLPKTERSGAPRLFVVDNVDPDDIAGLFQYMDMRTTLVNVVSKSGATAEIMAAYLIVRRLLEQQVPADQVAQHLVFTTDPYSGVLRKIGRLDKVRLFEIPAGVGGRFSVLSPVGLLPAALLGIDVRGLLAGAAATLARFEEADVVANPAYVYAALHFLEDTRFRRRINVMMPYSNRLRDVAGWFRQLWAESLGKAVDRQGLTVHAGLTPIRALGATDQHSQVQLYVEGPDDKMFTFVRVERFDQEVVIPALQDPDDPLAYLGGHSLGDLLNTELEATAWALARRKRPSLTIHMPTVDAPSLGQFFMLLEAATAVTGELYDINAFDQPGVELGKEATYALMGRPGFEDLAAEIRGGVADGEAPVAGAAEGAPPREAKRYLVA